MKKNNIPSAKSPSGIIELLHHRFATEQPYHSAVKWDAVAAKLKQLPKACAILEQMENTGGAPALFTVNAQTGIYTFADFADESPAERRSLCYDQAALDKRKENKPKNSACTMATQMGIELLNKELYEQLQSLKTVDTKTSSWLLTPAPIRKLGGAIFGDWRYGTVFTYHNGAESYYAGRGFRGYVAL